MNARGLTLAETLIALFLLSGAAMASLALLTQAGRNQRLTLETLTANRFATVCLERIRGWAHDPNNFATGWSIYADTTVLEPSYPGLSARIQAAPTYQPLTSPNASLEAAFAPATRSLNDSMRAVKITVTWFSTRPRTLVVQGWVGAPLRTVGAPSLAFTMLAGIPGPMAVNATAVYKVELLDVSGQPIPGVFYRRSIDSSYATGDPGMGSIEVLDRTGDRCGMINHYYDGDPDRPTAPGDVTLRAYCRYGGREYSQKSSVIQLAP